MKSRISMLSAVAVAASMLTVSTSIAVEMPKEGSFVAKTTSTGKATGKFKLGTYPAPGL